MKVNKCFTHRQQRGVILPLILVFLLVMAFLGFSALGSARLEEKMAANASSQLLAFQAAEHALRFCETQLQLTPIPSAIAQLQQGPIPVNHKQSKNHWEIAENWHNDDVSIKVPAMANAGTSTTSVSAPRCLVERLQFEAGLQFRLQLPEQRPAFRITARGTGASDDVVVLLQSYLLL